MEIIDDDDLETKQYPLDVLEYNIRKLSLIGLLRYQHLDANFCKKYILDEKYQSADEYYTVTIDYVLFYQPHLKYKDLL